MECYQYSIFTIQWQRIPETVCENRLNMLNTAANVNRKLKPGFIRIFFHILTQNSSSPKLQHANIYDSSNQRDTGPIRSG